MTEVSSPDEAGSGVVQARSRVAGCGVGALAVVYMIHWLTVLFVVMLPERRTAGYYAAGIVIGAVVLSLLTWAAVSVHRGGRIVGAVLLSSLLTGGATLSAGLAASSILGEHPWFVALQILMLICAIGALILLCRTHMARVEIAERETRRALFQSKKGEPDA